MRRKRLKIFRNVIFIIMLALGIRLYDIQVNGAEDLHRAAVQQQTVKIILDEIEKNDDCQVRYLYITSMSRLEASGVYLSEFYQILREIGGVRTGEKYNDYYIFESREYDENTAERMRRRFGTLIIQDAGQYDENTVSAYADRDGNFMPGMPFEYKISQ